ncbi:MAG: hypothetical protein QS98_C0013G0027 [archaeon GW2011_AR3]|nr:MAG: hypothetical protein QS98_C0013G0027 [archaeon GW2011_AR3]
MYPLTIVERERKGRETDKWHLAHPAELSIFPGIAIAG